MKKILSVLIIICILLSVFTVAPVADDGFTNLPAVQYGTLNNYTRTDELDGTVVSGMVYSTSAHMQSYAHIIEKGFIDKTTLPFVTFSVRAESEGMYKIKPTISVSSNYTTGDYFFVVSVNDQNFYKCEVEKAGNFTTELNVPLSKGINLIRIITRVKETYSIVSGNTLVNVYGLDVQDGLTGILPGDDLLLYPGKATYVSNYHIRDTYLAEAGQHLDDIRAHAYAFETIKIGNINEVPSFSYTVDVPEDGFYDISLYSHTGSLGSEAHMVMFVDHKKYKMNYIDYNGYTNLSVFIPKGTHVISLTSAWSHSSYSNSYATWCDLFELKFISGGVSLSATQKNPALINDPTRMEAEVWGNTNEFGEPSQWNGSCSGDGCSGNANWDSGKSQSLSSLSTYFDKSNMLYLTFAVDAPEDGRYTVKPGYFWSQGTAHNVALLVNDKNVYSVSFAKRGTANFNITETALTLKKGRNIIRLIPFTSDNNAGTGYINVDYLDIDERLTPLDSKNYNRVEAESSVNVNNMSITGDGNLGRPVIEDMVDGGYTISSLTLDRLPLAANFSFNVTAPADGYYDMTALFYTKEVFASDPFYFGLLVDGKPTAHGWRRDTAHDNGISDIYAVNKADLTAYLTKGDHVITVTSPMSASVFNEDDFCRADFDALLLYGGLTLSDVQTEPEASVSVYYEAENTPYKHHYFARVDKSQPWHADGNVGGANTAHPMSFNDLEKYIDQNTSYVVFAVNAPSDGTYSMKLRFNIGCKDNSQALYDRFTAEGGSRPYAALLVNGKAYKVEHPTQCGWISTSDIFNIDLKEGVNYIYAFAPTKEIMDIMTGAYIDFDALIMQRGLTQADANLYILGDTTGDTYFDLRDLLRFKRYLAEPSGLNLDHVSANLDGDSLYNFDANDIAILVKMLLDPENAGSQYTWVQEYPEAKAGLNTIYSQPLENNYMKDGTELARVYSKSNYSPHGMTVSVTSNKKQLFEGFGAAVTDTTAYNLKQLPIYERQELYTDLFSDSEGDALDLTFLRQPLGTSDFTVGSYYTYDDVPQGSTDTSLSKFSLGRDFDHIIPIVKEMQQYNKNMRFFGGIWTAPLWMKTHWDWNTIDDNNNAIKNTIQTQYYSVYADYIVKALKAYDAQGIHIDYISAQNEPDGNHDIPSTWFDKWYMEDFVAGHLYPKMQSGGVTTKLLGYDFNWFTTDSNNMSRTTGFIKGPRNKLDGKNYGIAFHPYMGTVEVQALCHSYYPNMPIYITEAAGNTSSDNFFSSVEKTVLSLRNYANAYIYWNIMLDENRGPLVGNISGVGIGLTEYDTTTGNYRKLSDYYALAHFSKYIKENAYIVDSTDTGLEVSNVVALNPDGSYSAVLTNRRTGNVAVNLDLGNGYIIKVNVPAKATVSLSWNPATVAQYAQ